MNMVKLVTRAIILDKDKRVLLGKRAEGSMGAGQWALIGGKPDEGEPLDKTIVREVNEELGVIFINPTFWKDEKTTDSNNNPWHVYYYWGSVEGGLHLKLDEVPDARYFTQDELKTLDIAFNHKTILTQFFEGVQDSKIVL